METQGLLCDIMTWKCYPIYFYLHWRLCPIPMWKMPGCLDWKIHAYKRLKQYESFLTTTSPRIAILSMLLEISGNLIFDVNSHANQFSQPFFSILTEDDFIIIWSRNQFCKYLFLIFIIYTFYTTRKYSWCLPCHLREIYWGKQCMFLTL